MVLERPEIPLHTNGSENDIRCQVTRRKISAGTRSEIGRDCRDAFLSLAKTCDKLICVVRLTTNMSQRIHEPAVHRPPGNIYPESTRINEQFFLTLLAVYGM